MEKRGYLVLFPDVDGWLGLIQLLLFCTMLRVIPAGEKEPLPIKSEEKDYPRLLTTPKHTAYLENCRRLFSRLSFCLIPHIQNALRSRPPEPIYDEAVQLAATGVKEVILVAQIQGLWS